MKYIVICYPRTGSTLLCTALRAHPNLGCAMEIFGADLSDLSQDYALWRYKQFQRLFQGMDVTILKNQERLLNFDNYDFKEFSKQLLKDWNGFKIISSHIPVDSDVWDVFINADVKCLFLERDIADACCSFETAKQNKKWHALQHENISLKLKTEIVANDVEWFCDQYVRPYLLIKKQLMSSCEHMVMYYNDLCVNWDKTIQNICAFLEVDQCKLEKQLSKTGPKKYNHVNNYDEILAVCAQQIPHLRMF